MRTSFVLAHLGACLFLLLALPFSAGAALISDNFDDNALDPALWSPLTFGDSTIDEANQRLEFTASDGAALARLRGLVTGDFDLRFDYAVLTDMDSLDPNEDEPFVGLLFFGFDSFLIRSITTPPPGEPPGCFASQVGEVIAEDCYGLTSELSGTFRITRAANVYTIYHWQDANWTPLASGTSVLTGPVDFYLGAGTGSVAVLGGAIDNFWLQSGGFISEVPEPASFGLAGVALGLALILRKRLHA